MIDLTIERMDFIRSNAVFENKEEIYLATLIDLENKYKAYPASTEISFQIAYLYNNQANQYNPKQNTTDQFKRSDALKICKSVIQRFPKSKGANKCRSLEEQIKKENLQISVEKFIPINTPSRLLIHYKNISSLDFKVFKIDQNQMDRFTSLRKDSERVGFIDDLLVEKQWNSVLKTENDYQEHSTEVLLPELNPGRYMIVSHKKDQLKKDEIYAYAFVQVTDISLVRMNDPKLEIWQVINRNTGKPIKNAKIHAKSETNYANKVKQIDPIFYSDKNGFFSFEKKNYYNIHFDVKTKNDKAVFGDYYIYKNNYRQNEREETLYAKTFLFTDRSIYRPGQTVYFKGILIQMGNNKSTTVANEMVTVTLYDVNGEEVKELELTTNTYGSFSSEFILPANGLTGAFRIEVDKGNTDSNFYNDITNFELSSSYISVEEYKRPKFETTFKPIKESFRLNDSITVMGEAISFSGAKISNAKVKYRVVRTENYPSIYRYYNPYPRNSTPQEIIHWETTTDLSGNYSIKFKAIPDLKIKKEQKPVFSYKIYADVTDINGETHHTETTVRVAYHMLEIQLSIAESINKNLQNNTIIINSKNLNGEFIPTIGQLKIYKLKSPNELFRKSPWQSPDYPGFTKEAFKKLFPHDAYQNENNEKNWEKGAVVFEQQIDTKIQKEVTLTNIKNWETGKYIAVFNCSDKYQQKINTEKRFNVKDYSGKEIGKENLISVTTDKEEYSVGEFVNIKLSSAANIFVTIFIEKDHKTVDQKIIHLSNNSKIITVPVNKEDIGGFAVHYQTAFFNSFKKGTVTVHVPYPKNELQIITQTFRDKIQPGSEQQWSFSIKGDQKDKVFAEILASMYDASLDQFKTHYWNFTPVTFPIYQSYNKSSANRSFGTANLNIRNLRYHYFSPTKRQYDQLNWFGFSFNNNRWVKRQYLRKVVNKYTKPKINSSNDQSKEKEFIYGVVYDESDELPGVNVIVKGTRNGVTTDFDGKFKIKAKKGDILIISFIGMETMELKIKKDNIYSIKMTGNEESLDEVVVTALGISKQKNSLGYEVTEEAENVDNISFALADRVAGVEVAPAPEASKKLIIRGNSSINNKALIIIDGIPFTGNEDFELTEEDILSVKVLKGEEATALYGSQGKNGVMLITTKAGQEKINSDLNKVQARTNFKETAFFYPNLTTDKEGNFTFKFTIPEALTKWKLQLLAHTKDLRTGYKQLNTITQKDLMVVPNIPRFLRENDTIIINTKITNLSKEKLNGIAQLKLSDALSGKDITLQLLENSQDQNKNFSADTKNSTTVQWKVFIPKNHTGCTISYCCKSRRF